MVKISPVTLCTGMECKIRDNCIRYLWAQTRKRSTSLRSKITSNINPPSNIQEEGDCPYQLLPYKKNLP